MPNALLRLCAHPGCPTLVVHGRCPQHAREVEQRRGSRSARGYTDAWYRYKARLKARMIRHGIAPVCGATLPGGPQAADSQCLAAGRLVDRSANEDLHLDHEPPLQPAERHNPRAVMDDRRVQFLCGRCHSAKTRRQRDATAERVEGGSKVQKSASPQTAQVLPLNVCSE